MRKFIILFAALSILTSSYTFAQETENPEPTRPPRPTRELSREPRPSREAREDNDHDEDDISRPLKPTRNPSDDPKSRACEAIKQNLKRQADNTKERVEKFYDQVESIQKRVEEYYTSKLVPAGKTLPNHDALVKDIQDKKALVDDAVRDMQKSVDEATCDVEKPGQTRKVIRGNIKAVVDALQDYKKSLRNFIVAVHKLSSGGQAAPSEAPTATKTPSLTVTPVISPTP